MQRKWSMLATGILLSSFLAGCANHQGNQTTRSMNAKNAPSGVHVLNESGAKATAVADRLNRDRSRASRAMSDRISGLAGVGNAHVYVDGKDAYVALSLEQPQQSKAKGQRSSAGMNAKGANPYVPLSQTKNTYGLNGNMGTSGTYGTNGMYPTGGTAMYGPKAAKALTNNGSIRSLSGLTAHHPNGMTQLSKHTGEGLVQYSKALTARNAPTAKGVKMKSTAVQPSGHAGKLFGLDRKGFESRSVSDDMKRRITKEVKSLSPNVTNVHISTDPDYLTHMKVYRGYLKVDHNYKYQP